MTRLAWTLALGLAAAPPCLPFGGGSSGGGSSGGNGETHSCPQAQTLWDHAETRYAEMRQELRFGSTWEYRHAAHTKAPGKFTRFGHISMGYSGTYEASSQAELVFTMPAAPTFPLTCEQVTTYAQYMPEPDAKEMVDYELAWAAYEAFSGSTAHGTETVTVSHEEEYNLEYMVLFGLICAYDNPCPDIREERSECAAQSHTFQIEPTFAVSWVPGEPTLLSMEGPDAYEDVPRETRTWTGNNPPDFDVIIVNPDDVCANVFPICTGRTSKPDGLCPEISGSCCGSDDIPFKNASTSYTSSDGRFTESVTLRCINGCDCIDEARCDDGRECTRDSCEGGNCVNTPDDSLVPEQVQGDCRRCEDGEVVSVRKEFEETCQGLVQDSVSACASAGRGAEDWIVSWEKVINGASDWQHFCAAGGAAGDMETCNGAGNCTSGTSATSLEAVEDKTCHSYDGQENHFYCQVNCTVCHGS